MRFFQCLFFFLTLGFLLFLVITNTFSSLSLSFARELSRLACFKKIIVSRHQRKGREKERKVRKNCGHDHLCLAGCWLSVDFLKIYLRVVVHTLIAIKASRLMARVTNFFFNCWEEFNWLSRDCVCWMRINYFVSFFEDPKLFLKKSP